MRIRLTHRDGGQAMEIGLADIGEATLSARGSGTNIHLGDACWMVNESIDQICALEAAAKAPAIAAGPTLPESCDYRLPWQVCCANDGAVEIRDAENLLILEPRHHVSAGSVTAQAVEHMVACANLAAKAPPAEEAKLEWRKWFKPPLKVAPRFDDPEYVGIVGANDGWLDIAASAGSPDAALLARMVKCVNKCEAD